MYPQRRENYPLHMRTLLWTCRILCKKTSVMETASPLEERLTAFMDRVWIGICVGEPVVGAVTPAPEPNRALESTGTTKTEEDLERKSRGICAMRPESVIPCCDTYAGPEMQQNGEDECGALKWRVVRVVAGY